MNIKLLIKALISVLMLVLVFRAVDFSNLFQAILDLDPLAVACVVVMYAAGQSLNTVKWWIIARAGNVRVPYAQALRACFIGMYVNCFGLGTVGGDLVRGLLLAKEKQERLPAFASVFADRAHGLAVLASIGAVSILIFGRLELAPSFAFLLVALSLGIALAWFIGPRLLLLVLPGGSRVREKAEQVVAVFPSRIGTIVAITSISVAFHLLQISMHWVMGQSVGVAMPLAYLLVAIPFVNILSTLPMSWNGLGVRETAYVFFLVPTVLTREQAVIFGTLWLLSVVVSSALGGIVALWSKDFELIKTRAQEKTPLAGAEADAVR